MPFIYDETSIELPDDGTEPPPPRADQFIYFKPADWAGEADPVRFTVPSLDVLSTQKQLAPAPETRQAKDPGASTPPQKPRGWLSRLFGALAGQAPKPRPPRATGWFGPEEARRRTQIMMALLVPALRELGVKQAYCRYDGGNDEGFAWLDHVRLSDGTRLDPGALASLLIAQGLGSRLLEEGLATADTRHPLETRVKNAIGSWLISEWAALLLGSGFGTGEYQLYGAFTVDLEACTITDDPEAKAIVENITLADGDT